MTRLLPAEIPALQERVRAWLCDEILPEWRRHGVDPNSGAFVERRHLDGSPDTRAPRRFRVQSRQVFSFCYATERKLIQGVEGLVSRAAERMIADYWHDDGGWVFEVAPDGTVSDSRRELYEQAFALLAFAWLYRAFRADQALAWIDRTLAFVDWRCGDPRYGGFLEGVPPSLPRRQNPHMHLLEAFLALFQATGDEAWRHRAEAVIDLFQAHFFDAGTGTLREFFTLDWHPAAGAEGALREPGHHFEWVWLLLHYRRLTGDEGVLEPADRLYRTALEFGVDSPQDGIPAAFDVVDSSGTVVDHGKRLWPQTEAVKAHLARHELLGDAEAADRARAHLAMMFDHYLGADDPTWRDRLARDGRALSDHIPSSTLYHLFLCVAETLRVLD